MNKYLASAPLKLETTLIKDIRLGIMSPLDLIYSNSMKIDHSSKVKTIINIVIQYCLLHFPHVFP